MPEQPQDIYETKLASRFAKLNEENTPVLGSKVFTQTVMMMLFLTNGDESMTRYYFHRLTHNLADELSKQQIVTHIKNSIEKKLPDMVGVEKELFKQLLGAMAHYDSDDANDRTDARKFFSTAAKFCSISPGGTVIYAAKLLESIMANEIAKPTISYYYLKKIRANTKLAMRKKYRYDSAVSKMPYEFYETLYQKATTALAMHPKARITDIIEYAAIAPKEQYMDLIQDAEGILNKDILAAIDNPEDIATVVESRYEAMRTLLKQMMDSESITEEQKALLMTFYNTYSSDAADEKILNLLSPQPIEYIKQAEQTAQNRVLELEAESAGLREENAGLQRQLQEQSEQHQKHLQEQERRHQEETERLVQEIEDTHKAEIEKLEKENKSLKEKLTRFLKLLDAKLGLIKMFFRQLHDIEGQTFNRGRDLIESAKGLEKGLNATDPQTQYNWMTDMEDEITKMKRQQMEAQGRQGI